MPSTLKILPECDHSQLPFPYGLVQCIRSKTSLDGSCALAIRLEREIVSLGWPIHWYTLELRFPERYRSPH